MRLQLLMIPQMDMIAVGQSVTSQQYLPYGLFRKLPPVKPCRDGSLMRNSISTRQYYC
jgi:hypothetical protein